MNKPSVFNTEDITENNQLGLIFYLDIIIIKNKIILH